MNQDIDANFAFQIEGEFTNRFFWEVLPDRSWYNTPCYIIGGGPSLEREWAWLRRKLEGKLTIGINRAYEQYDPTIIFGMDPKFIRWIQMGKYGNPAIKKFAESKAYKVWLCTYKCSLPDDIYILKIYRTYTESLRSFPFSMKEGIGCGSNSGYAALNLAACLGANPIYLIGFDLKHSGTQTHWHDGHPEPQKAYQLDRWKRFFGIAAQALHAKNVDVINLNPDSALECFPKADMRVSLEPKPVKSIKPVISLGHYKHAAPAKIDKKGFKAPETKLPSIYIIGPYGFGDTFYLRSIVKNLAKKHMKVYIRTTLPEAFWDINNVRFVRPNSDKLRAQKEHIEKLDKSGKHKWERPPGNTKHRSWESFLPEWKHTAHSPEAPAVSTNPRGEESTTEYFANEFGIKDFDFSFPVRKEWLEAAQKITASFSAKGKKLCIVRQPTVRRDWRNISRAPKTEYFQLLLDRYRNEYYYISIANNKENEEWFTGKLRRINRRFDHGELPLATIFGLMKLADMVIAPPDFFSVMAIALRTKCFCIFGGCAKPSVIFNENMGLENFEHIAPDPFCNCMRMDHDCNKDISYKEIIQKFESLHRRERHIKEVSVGLPPGIGDMHWVLTALESFKEKSCIDRLNVILNLGPGHGYSKEFLALVPFVDSAESSPTQLPFKFSIIGGEGTPLQQSSDGADYIMEFNSCLEHGIKLKDILPEYDVDFNYPIEYPATSKRFAEGVKKEAGGKLYLFYASSVAGNKNWTHGKWSPEHWVKLADKIYGATGCRTVLIGAEWDKSYSDIVMKLDKKNRIHNLCGKTSVVQALALIREANAMVSFLSGLVIIATRFKTPTVSFWPTKEMAPAWHDPKVFKESWVPPNAREQGYMPFDYGDKEATPLGVFKAIRKYL